MRRWTAMKARSFDEVEFQAVVWLANQALHPQGYHLAIISGDYEVPRWVILGDGEELASSNDIDEDVLFRTLHVLLKEARDFNEGT